MEQCISRAWTTAQHNRSIRVCQRDEIRERSLPKVSVVEVAKLATERLVGLVVNTQRS